MVNTALIWACQFGVFDGNYRIVLKYWDTQRIGTSLKIVKIIILADPKNLGPYYKNVKISGILAIQRIGTAFLGPQNDQKRA